MHTLSNIDPTTRFGICGVCGPVKLHTMGFTKAGARRWRCRHAALASKAASRRRGNLRGVEKMRATGSWPPPLPKAATCERCGFVPEVASQLDVHHRDGDKANSHKANLITLCANCHRLIHSRRT